MPDPEITHVVKDEQNDITYTIYAFRPLTESEMIGAIRNFHQQARKVKIKRGTNYDILTTIGQPK